MTKRIWAAQAVLCSGILCAPASADLPDEATGACIANNQTGDGYTQAVNAYLTGPPGSLWTDADCRLMSPVWTGDDNKGQLFTPLWRGVGTAFEDYVVPTPASTDIKGTIRLDWDKAANTVHYTIKLHHAPASPTVSRVDGGDPEISDPGNPRHFIPPPQANWWYNAFHQNPKDLPIMKSDGTGYRVWTIYATFNSVPIANYYDPNTLMLLGNSYGFPSGPPPGAITVSIGENVLAASLLMYPDAAGFASRQYTVPYNQVTTEGGYHGYASGLFVPQNLCRSNPYQPALGQLRPIVSHWQPASAGKSWDTYLDNGLFFDTTIEEGRPDLAPGQDDQDDVYVYSATAILDNIASAQGGVPWGYHFQLATAIQNVQPALVPVSRAGGFDPEPAVTAPLYCVGQQ